ncbi:MAG TPA: CDP-diacylglycerol--serine O-phosphatidyltransferase [Rikenellaceae bacterium]|nr:CDP-diacylglycerol--serine O-phosphatidyltransferase [Rikenellaceae bacterium]HBH21780.1 CDP-diacylglycerol--serine O-phosphatidyltransferase [Rikenellaceae bacterium]
MKKIISYIPDCITSMNLLCGIIGVVFAFKCRFDMAFYFMMAAAVFDFLDGFVARLLGAYSDMGKELDSLSDVVSFGVLPSVMLYSLMKTFMFEESLVCWVPLLIAVFSGIRLAKFNVDSRQHSSFLGLPTPACALLCASLAYFVCATPNSFLALWVAGPVFIPALSLVLCFLLVCELPMFSFKFSKDDSKSLKLKRLTFLALVAIVSVVCLLCSLNWSLIVMFAIVLYILKNIVYFFAKI